MTPIFTIIIPARFKSVRLPGKPLLDIAGKPMIERVYQQALKTTTKKIIIATDDQRIYSCAKSFNAEVCLTHSQHTSGTDRLQEVATQLALHDDDIVVNVQGDEPLIPPELINQVAYNLVKNPLAQAATLSTPISDLNTLQNPSVVKVITNKLGYAIYFSRAAIPSEKETTTLFSSHLYQRHIGIYAYRVGVLHKFVQWQPCPLELTESLEQLRLLWNNQCIHVDQACIIPEHGVDTQNDLNAIRQRFNDNT